jgi:hypothetical protein
VNNLQYLIAQFGPTAARRLSQAMLLEPAELAGSGWVALDQKIWRTGTGNRTSDAGRRAHRAQTFTAMRSFRQATPSRWLWVEVVPYVSAQDALSVLPTLPARFVPNPKAEVTVVSEQFVEPSAAPEVAAFPFIYEQLTTGRHGPSAARYVAGHVEQVVFVVACSALDAAWPWSDVAAVAFSQESRIRRNLGTATSVAG